MKAPNSPVRTIPHKEDTEQRESVLRDLFVGVIDDPFPIQAEAPAKERIQPAMRKDKGIAWLMQSLHGDDADADTSHGHESVFDHVPEHDAVHAAENRVEGREQGKDNTIEMRDILQGDMKGDIVFDTVPRNEDLHEFSQADEAISHKTETT
jgi:hypothetical protein